MIDGGVQRKYFPAITAFDCWPLNLLNCYFAGDKRSWCPCCWCSVSFWRWHTLWIYSILYILQNAPWGEWQEDLSYSPGVFSIQYNLSSDYYNIHFFCKSSCEISLGSRWRRVSSICAKDLTFFKIRDILIDMQLISPVQLLSGAWLLHFLDFSTLLFEISKLFQWMWKQLCIRKHYMIMIWMAKPLSSLGQRKELPW